MIVCEGLSKSYRVHAGWKHVLRDVSFTISPGERIGLLGRNGAGKSTLIRMIGGVELPNSGTVRRKMTCSWPLGFTGGFQGSLTGLDNAKFIARIYNQDYRRVRKFVEDFTELGTQLANPVKTYSSGMRARLAFALSLVIEFECYLIDEVIMVGDQNFQQKCQDEFFNKRTDRALVIASHSTELIQQYCNRAVVIRNQRAEIFDNVSEALEIYSDL